MGRATRRRGLHRHRASDVNALLTQERGQARPIAHRDRNSAFEGAPIGTDEMQRSLLQHFDSHLALMYRVMVEAA